MCGGHLAPASHYSRISILWFVVSVARLDDKQQSCAGDVVNTYASLGRLTQNNAGSGSCHCSCHQINSRMATRQNSGGKVLQHVYMDCLSSVADILAEACHTCLMFAVGGNTVI